MIEIQAARQSCSSFRTRRTVYPTHMCRTGSIIAWNYEGHRLYGVDELDAALGARDFDDVGCRACDAVFHTGRIVMLDTAERDFVRFAEMNDIFAPYSVNCTRNCELLEAFDDVLGSSVECVF